MLHNLQSSTLHGSWLLVVASIAMSPSEVTAQMNLLGHAVFEKYPSPGDVAQQMRKLRNTHPGLVNEVLADFDLAIRSSLILEPPPIPGRPKPIVARQATTGWARSRASLLNLLHRCRNSPERAAQLEFYERHIQELVFDDHPHLALVMMHVLAHGWDDWSAWDLQDERLNRARREYPYLHRVNALSKIEMLRHKPAIGLLLRITVDDHDPLRQRARLALRMLGNEDVLRFYIDWALDPATSSYKRSELWTEIQMITGKGSREFWEPYLDSDVPTLWYCAQKVCRRPLPEGRDRRWLSKAQAQWNYEHERDPKIRRIIDLRRRIAEIRKRQDPETGRISLEDLAEIQGLQAEIKRLGNPEEKPDQPAP